MEEEFEDFQNQSIFKFESMLKTNSFLFFDSNEFEEIIVYYLEIGNASLAKKAVSLALKQYPQHQPILLVSTKPHHQR